MRVILFILLTVLVASCCSYRGLDYNEINHKILSLKDFEWIKEVPSAGELIIKEDSVYYSYPSSFLRKPSEKLKISRIDVSNGNFLDTIVTDEGQRSYSSQYLSGRIPYGFYYYFETPQNSCINVVNISISSRSGCDWMPLYYNVIIKFEIDNLKKKFGYDLYQFKLNKDEIFGINDFALFKGCYLIISFNYFVKNKKQSLHKIGLLDLKKLIYNY